MAEYNPSKIIKDGNTYNFRDNTKIPLAGSNAISGDLIPSTNGTVNLGSASYRFHEGYFGNAFCGGAVMSGDLYTATDDGGFVVGGGSGWGKGGTIFLRGINYSPEPGVISIHLSDNIMYLRPNGAWSWSGQPCQTASDQRLKQQIAEIDDKLLDAWEDVDLVQFKYNDAVKEKSDNARLHTGYVVQQIDKACKEHGVDVSAYGLYCHEVYQEETEEVEVEQADGTKIKERKVIREASEHYSLRYTEVYAVECMYLRRCIARLTARIEELEKGNNSK